MSTRKQSIERERLLDINRQISEAVDVISGRGDDLSTPTHYSTGTALKVALMTMRESTGVPIHVPGDSQLAPTETERLCGASWSMSVRPSDGEVDSDEGVEAAMRGAHLESTWEPVRALEQLGDGGDGLSSMEACELDHCQDFDFVVEMEALDTDWG